MARSSGDRYGNAPVAFMDAPIDVPIAVPIALPGDQYLVPTATGNVRTEVVAGIGRDRRIGGPPGFRVKLGVDVEVSVSVGTPHHPNATRSIGRG